LLDCELQVPSINYVEEIIQWKPLNMIKDNVIIQFM